MVRRWFPETTSQTRIAPSVPPLTSTLSSGAKASACANLSCRAGPVQSRLPDRSQSINSLLRVAEARKAPLAEKASAEGGAEALSANSAPREAPISHQLSAPDCEAVARTEPSDVSASVANFF